MASTRKKNKQQSQKILKRLTNLHLFKKRLNLKLSHTKNPEKKLLLKLLRTMKKRNNLKVPLRVKKPKLKRRKKPMMMLRKRKKLKQKMRRKPMMMLRKMKKLREKRKRIDGLLFRSVPYYQLDNDYGYICECLCTSGNQLFPFLFKNKSI